MPQCRLYPLGILTKFLADTILGKIFNEMGNRIAIPAVPDWLKCHSNSDIGKPNPVTYSNPAIVLTPGHRKATEKHVPASAVSTFSTAAGPHPEEGCIPSRGQAGAGKQGAPSQRNFKQRKHIVQMNKTLNVRAYLRNYSKKW